MAYGHGDLLASLGGCAVGWCSKPANGSITDDGRRLCPEHALQELVAEEATSGPAARGLPRSPSPAPAASLPAKC